MMARLRLALCTFLAALALIARAGTEADQARTVVHMLDYVSVDYPEFVQQGQVLDSAEYAEQLEFAQQVLLILEQLPKVDGAPDLLLHARNLHARITAKADGTVVSAIARALRGDVIAAYRVAVAPRTAPDLASAQALYTAHCASCHGSTGHGDGPQAPGMEPAPRDFHDAAAMAVRSPFGLYNTITLGVAGTDMLGYGGLTEEERWALALYTASMRSTDEEVERGAALWAGGEGKEQFTSLSALVTATPEETAQQHGRDRATVLAFLTARPEAVQVAGPSPLNISRERLAEALAAYRNGQVAEARRLSISAYLEGFELVEAALDNVDAPLRRNTEREMMKLRSLISSGASPDSLEAGIARIHVLLDQAEDQLSGDGLSSTAIFLSSLLILLREGLEAILVLAAILAFVRKTGRRDALPYIHAGWIAAVLLGIGTWLAARHLIRISGADREITEGITALLAAAMLLYVGWWLHNKSNARAWNRYIKDKVGQALGRGTLWTLVGIAFLAVYREFFEIILFYESLISQAGPRGGPDILWGVLAASGLLVVIGGAILKYSVRLPIGPFFAVTGLLLALLAVVFAGNGIAALQEAGVFDATFIRFITVPVLGIHPTVQGLVTQGAVLLLVVVLAWAGRWRMRRLAAE